LPERKEYETESQEKERMRKPKATEEESVLSKAKIQMSESLPEFRCLISKSV